MISRVYADRSGCRAKKRRSRSMAASNPDGVFLGGLLPRDGREFMLRMLKQLSYRTGHGGNRWPVQLRSD
jgi:hypothetical protein